MPRDRTITGGGRFTIRVTGDPPVVTKSGAEDAVGREVEALTAIAGTGHGPQLLAHTTTEVTMSFVEGSPRPLSGLSADDARRLGRSLRAVHDLRHLDSGGRHVWARPVASLREYAEARLTDQEPIGAHLRDLARDVAARLRAVSHEEPTPFRLLHGDLTAANIVWTPRPVFVDWEYWRTGDPAEDLAYLAVMNAVPDAVMTEVLTGYGDDRMRARVDAWRASSAFDAALWYLRDGDPNTADRMLDVARASLAR